MECGEKIAELRKARGLTQTDLGSMLNVTFQAVSKWERGESYPDFETMVKIANIFQVKVEYFSVNEEMAAASAPAQEQAQKVLLGTCTVCGKAIYEDAEHEWESAYICKECSERRKRKAETDARQKIERQKEEEKKARMDKLMRGEEIKKRRTSGFVWASIVCVVLLIGSIITTVSVSDAWSSIIVAAFSFFFMTQVIWGGVVQEIACTGGRIVGTPGIIFEFDLDGFIFLIAMKILFALIRFVIWAVTGLFFVFIALIISPFTFGFTLAHINRDIKNGEDTFD